MRTTSSYLYAQCLLSVELVPAKSSIRLQSSQQAVGKNFRAPDSDINSVDCKVANGKVSGECGGMKTAQVAHSRGRRIRRTRGSTGVDFQMLMVDRVVPQGVCEQQLPECQVNAIPDQGRGDIPGGECIAVSFLRVLTGAVPRQ